MRLYGNDGNTFLGFCIHHVALLEPYSGRLSRQVPASRNAFEIFHARVHLMSSEVTSVNQRSKAINYENTPTKVPSLRLPEPASAPRETKDRLLESYRARKLGGVESVATGENTGGTSSPEIPPFVFRRIPKLADPIVDTNALQIEAQDGDASGFERLIDTMFGSHEKIYEDIIHKLRQHVVVLQNRNSLLEANLDTAEIEIEYWRDVYTKKAQLSLEFASSHTKPPLQTRHITPKAWKLAVAKFVGSGDQFLSMKVLFHWRQHVLKLKAGLAS